MSYELNDLVLIFRILAACVLTLGIFCIVAHQHVDLSVTPIQLYGASLVAMGIGMIGIARATKAAGEIEKLEEEKNQPKSE